MEDEVKDTIEAIGEVLNNTTSTEDKTEKKSSLLNFGADVGVDAKVNIPQKTIMQIGGTIIICAIVIAALSFLVHYLNKKL